MKKAIFGIIFAAALVQGCDLFTTEVTYYIGVVDEAVIFVAEPDYQYETTSVSFEGTTFSAGEYEEINIEFKNSETSKSVEVDYVKYDQSDNFLKADTSIGYIYPDDGEYVCFYAFTFKQFSTLEEMNEFLSDNGMPTFSDDGSGGSSSSGVCGDDYEGPDSDPQRDSYCQYAYAYRCLYGYSVSSSEVQTYCDYYDAMNNGGPECPYCE